jgi:hypothetical protein
LGDTISCDGIILAKYCQSETKDANLPKNRRAMQVKNSFQSGVAGGREPVIDPMENFTSAGSDQRKLLIPQWNVD